MSGCYSSCSTVRICPDGQRYAAKQMALPPKKAVVACEGACIKGEVARTAANRLAYRLQKSNAVRICLGDAATGNSGMTELVKRAPEVIVIEGCPLHCGLTVLKSRIPDLKATVIDASKLYSFDREANFEIYDLPREEIEKFAGIAADHAAKKCFPEGGN